jgi:hypothetical protein
MPKIDNPALALAIEHFRSQGRFVMAVYAGLHIVSIESFSTAEEAADGVADRTERLEASERIEMFPPVLPVQDANPAAAEQYDEHTPGFATLAQFLEHVAPEGAVVVSVQVLDSHPF